MITVASFTLEMTVLLAPWRRIAGLPMKKYMPGQESAAAVQQSCFLDLLGLGPVSKLILWHLSSETKRAMMQACRAMRREASGPARSNPIPDSAVECPRMP
jgi:hypothetical protein